MKTTFKKEQLPSCTFKKEKSQTDLSICLVNWNTRDLLRDCLNSILSQDDGLTIELFVIDNASMDDSVDMIRKEFPGVHLIANGENLGFASANNQGIQLSEGRYIMLLNPDTIVLPGALRLLVDFLDGRPEAGAVAPKLLNKDNSLQYSLRKFPTYLTPFTENPTLMHVPLMKFYTEWSHLINWDHASIRSVDQPAGAAFMFRRSIVETLGLLDHQYHMFFEDVDLCYRIKQNGWEIFYIPASLIVHLGGQSVKQRHNIGEEFYKSLRRFFRIHFGIWAERKVRAMMILGSLCYILFASLITIIQPFPSMRLAKTAVHVLRCSLRN